MSDLPHIRLANTAESLPYTATVGGGGGEFRLPPRDRSPHAQKLRQQIQAAKGEMDDAYGPGTSEDDETRPYLFTLRSDAQFELKLESIERLKQGIELLSVRKDGEITVASISIRREKLSNFLRLIKSYETQDTKDGKPKNKPLIESIASISRLIVRDLWQDVPEEFPKSDQAIWWEVWLRRGQEQAVDARFRALAKSLGLLVGEHTISFPERLVLLAKATPDKIGESPELLACIAELRKAKELPTEYLSLAPRDQRYIIQTAVNRLIAPGQDAPAVCLLDTGVNRNHPLLELVLAQNDTQSVDPQWGAADHDREQHGTGMAGIAAYGCLTALFESDGPLLQRHRLESVKLLPPPPAANAPENYGWVTQEAVAKAEIKAPNRNRAICMAVTADDRDQGLPSSWSAAIDQMCSGELDKNPKLMFISAGNYEGVQTNPDYCYPDTNFTDAGIQDPAQAWNAVTVGAYTDLTTIKDPKFQQWSPIAPAGDLTPSSRTSLPWPPENQKGWPIKPDFVMEGGNYIINGRVRDRCDDHVLLTTTVKQTGELFSTMADTSAAAAGAARLAAQLWSHYPSLRPETIRALLVHSARWTPAMESRCPGSNRGEIQRRLRCYGYGVANLHRAVYSAENAATLIYEGELQPFLKDKGTIKTNEWHLHQIPWPTEVLMDLRETMVSMRVTLSYFVEPSPGRKGWGKKHRFQSHGLRFDVVRPVETIDQFKKRISRALWDEDEGRPATVSDDGKWTVGSNGRTRGSIHSDWWNGTASDLAECGWIAVYPVIGWWRERQHLNRLDSTARYSLIISIETPDEHVDLYTPIAIQAAVSTELVV